jgi:hypothetical protein
MVYFLMQHSAEFFVFFGHLSFLYLSQAHVFSSRAAQCVCGDARYHNKAAGHATTTISWRWEYISRPLVSLNHIDNCGTFLATIPLTLYYYKQFELNLNKSIANSQFLYNKRG